MVIVFPFFPLGLGFPFFMALSPLGLEQLGGLNLGPFNLNGIISCGFYLGHFIATCSAQSRRRFLILMAILLIAVAINAFGLHLMIHN